MSSGTPMLPMILSIEPDSSFPSSATSLAASASSARSPVISITCADGNGSLDQTFVR